MSVLFGLVVSTSAVPATVHSPQLPMAEWAAEKGDRFIVDTKANVGYLVHENGTYTSMFVGSGKRQVVHYIGKTYNAATPPAKWVVKSKHLYGDRITFGKSGRFLRLYDNGTTYTSYGIHATANIDDMLTWDDRYKSMGCILVSESVMDILEATYALNGNSLDVVTAYGLDENML